MSERIEKIIAAVEDVAWKQPLGRLNARHIVEALDREGFDIVSRGDEGTRQGTSNNVLLTGVHPSYRK